MADQLFFERFIWFDAQVRKGKHPNANQLAKEFEISGKTAQRSIEWFRDRMRAPLEYDVSLKGYYYRDPSFGIPLAQLSERQLVALLISKRLLTDAAAGDLGDDLSVVSEKLGGLLSAHLPGRISPDLAFSFRWTQFTPSDGMNFGLVSHALLHGRLLSFCYYSPKNSECTVRTVEPHHLVNYLGNWHLIAWCRLRGEWRNFLITRMTLTQEIQEEFAFRPEEEWRPRLEETFGIFINEESFRVVLRFTPERSRWVRGQQWHPGQEELLHDDGSLQLSIPVSHHLEIKSRVLAHGAHVQVDEPQWLRDEVAQEIEAMRHIYNPKSPGPEPGN